MQPNGKPWIPSNSYSDPYSFLGQFYDGEGGQGGEWVGITVSMSADGEELAYGVLYHDSTGFQNEGQVKYCVVSSEQCSIISENAAQDDLVGTDVMISGNGNFIIYGSAGGNYASVFS